MRGPHARGIKHSGLADAYTMDTVVGVGLYPMNVGLPRSDDYPTE